MKLFSLGETEIRVSPFAAFLLPAAAALAGIRMTAAAFLSLTLHEAAHAITARRLGYAVRSVGMQPFGFTAEMDADLAAFGDAAAIYAAGPAASLSAAAFSALLEKLLPAYGALKLGFTEYNLLIALVNIIPALPLDGGRLVFTAFGGARAASAVLRAIGAAAGAAFIAGFLLLLRFGAFNPTFLIMGVFLPAAAFSEREKQALGGMVRRRIRRGSALPVGNIAVSSDTELKRAIALLPAGRYAVVSVVDRGSRIAEIDEARLREAASVLGAGASLKEAVALFGQKMV